MISEAGSRVLERLGDRQRSACDPLGERVAADESQHERAHAVAFLDPVNRSDMRMIERGQHARLPLEASQSISVVGKRPRQYLDRDIASEPGITGAVHLTHPAHADPFVHEICAEATAGDVHAFIDWPQCLRNHRRRQAIDPVR